MSSSSGGWIVHYEGTDRFSVWGDHLPSSWMAVFLSLQSRGDKECFWDLICERINPIHHQKITLEVKISVYEFTGDSTMSSPMAQRRCYLALLNQKQGIDEVAIKQSLLPNCLTIL